MNCFLFDIDGTVADTVPQMAISIKNSFSSLGRDYPPESEVRGYVGNGLDKLVLRSMKRSFDADYSDFSEEEFVKFKRPTLTSTCARSLRTTSSSPALRRP